MTVCIATPTARDAAGEPRRSSREAILAGALRCFERMGIRATRVEDDLREAQLSRGTFYRHFPNMDRVVMELAVFAARDILATAVGATAEPREQTATRVARVIARMAGRKDDPPIMRMIIESGEILRLSNLIMVDIGAMQTLAGPLVPLLEQGRADGTFRSELTTDHLVEWLTRNATSIRSRLPPWAHTVAELETYVMEFVMPGVLAQPRPTAAEAVLDRLHALEERLTKIAAAVGAQS